MTPRASLILCALVLTAVALWPGGVTNRGVAVAAQESQAGVPQYTVDPSWPKPLPNNWLLGGVSGIAVDERDHVWILHRPRVLTEADPAPGQGPPGTRTCCVPAPSVIEFDPAGNVVQAWGGKDGPGYKWPLSEHGIEIDRQGNVWTTDEGQSRRPTMGGYVVQKFTRDGKFLLQIGNYGVIGENDDVKNLGMVAQVRVDDAANEVYVAEGHRSRRMTVFDSRTGAFKRKWGAYGGPTHAGPPADYDPKAAPPKEFGEAHCVSLSRDGLVYVCDRRNNRVQVFKKDGTFVEEIVFVTNGVPQITPWDMGLSTDPEQKYMLIADGARMKVFVVQRKPMKVLGSFGRPGRMAGELLFINAVAMDSKGNVYTGEVTTGDRVQKFVPAGN